MQTARKICPEAVFSLILKNNQEVTNHYIFTMSEHGAALQTCNLELVKCLEELKCKRHAILEVINKQESEKALLERNIKNLQDKLNALNKSLKEHKNIYESYDKTISETETGFKKILESGQTLLNLVQLEASKLPNCNENKLPMTFHNKS